MDIAYEHYLYLHTIPELSGKEYKTSEYVRKTLEEMGYTPKIIGKTGVVADLVTDAALPWIILRSDLDALPVMENSGVPQPSTHPGVMHACGHDSHMAMLLAAAKELKGRQLPQNIRFLFQYAEETTQGASEMIELGALPDNLCAVFGMHVWPGVPEGTVATRIGPLMASSDMFRIEISGRSAHCGQRHLGADALLTAVDLVKAFPEIQFAAKDPEAVLFCGNLESGHSHNVVPDSATIRGTIRTFDPADRRAIKEKLVRYAATAAENHGTTAEVLWEGGCPPVCNDENLIRHLQALIPDMDLSVSKTFVAEDFSCYQEKAPGVLLWLGTGNTAPLHNDHFCVPQEILPAGVRNWILIATENWKERER